MNYVRSFGEVICVMLPAFSKGDGEIEPGNMVEVLFPNEDEPGESYDALDAKVSCRIAGYFRTYCVLGTSNGFGVDFGHPRQCLCTIVC